jgi:hypothetical protein
MNQWFALLVDYVKAVGNFVAASILACGSRSMRFLGALAAVDGWAAKQGCLPLQEREDIWLELPVCGVVDVV